MTLLNRLAAVALQCLIALDELVQVAIRSPIYLVTGHNLPSAHETISAWVGMSAALGKGWAIEAQKLIDAIFGQGHCARAANHEASVDSPAQ